MDNKKIAFQDDPPLAASTTKPGLKLQNKKSRFTQDNAKKAEERADFESRSDEFMQARAQQNKMVLELLQNYIQIVRDKTLIANKSSLAQTAEKDIQTKIINMANLLNNDEAQDEGMGSLAVVGVLLKAILLQRDTINELSYEISKLKNIASLVEKT